MWHLKTTTLPVAIGALSMVAKTGPNYVLRFLELRLQHNIKKYTHGHCTYPAKSIINVIFFSIPNIFHTLQT